MMIRFSRTILVAARRTAEIGKPRQKHRFYKGNVVMVTVEERRRRTTFFAIDGIGTVRLVNDVFVVADVQPAFSIC
jgi:hypothetical protein